MALTKNKSLIKKEILSKQNILFLVLMLAALIYSFWRCKYGFGGDDESFYLTVPHRFLLGDAMLWDEWNDAQFGLFLQIPIVWLYRTIAGTTEGIYLFARYAFMVIHAVISIFVYKRIRKYGYLSAFACVLYFLFVPFNINAFSYYSMALDLMLLSCVLIASSEDKQWISFIISGIAFAGVVLCMPTFAIVYFIYGIAVLIGFIIKKKTKFRPFIADNNMFSFKTFLLFTAGVTVLAIILLTFMLSRAGLSHIIEMIPILLNKASNSSKSVIDMTRYYISSILNLHIVFKCSVFIFIAMLAVLAVDKKRYNHRAVYFIIAIILSAVNSYVLYQCIYSDSIGELFATSDNQFIVPITFAGIISYILCKKKPKKIFFSLFLIPFLYSYLAYLGSTQRIYIAAIPMAVANVANLIFIAVFMSELKIGEYVNKKGMYISCLASLTVLVAVFGYSQVMVKTEFVYWERGGFESLTEEMTTGPAKGIVTNEKRCAEYERVSKDLEVYNNCKPDKILCLSQSNWYYLQLNNFPYATCSTWISDTTEKTEERLTDYYNMNPEKIPVYIYIIKQADWESVRGEIWDLSNIYSIAEKYGYTIKETNVSYQLTKIK